MNKFRFAFSCANVRTPEGRVALDAMVASATRIDGREFIEHCALKRFARVMGYAGRPLSALAQEHSVSFYRSTWKGRPCYFTDWSAYECVFLQR